MLFAEGRSSLVRLSDCIKQGIGNSLDTTVDLIDLLTRYEQPFKQMRSITEKMVDGSISAEEGDGMLTAVNQTIPTNDAQLGASLQGRLHSECLSVILGCCFALESYVNSLAYHLLRERDILGLLRQGHEATADILFDAIERMSTLTKWQTVASFGGGNGFDRSQSPYQCLKILFNFRNDIVHDKVTDYSQDRVNTRYYGKLPDPVFGLLDLSHVVFAADAYWDMITAVHVVLTTNMEEFHRHYNLKPWFDEDFEDRARRTSLAYRTLL